MPPVISLQMYQESHHIHCRHVPYHHRGSTSLKNLLLTCKLRGFMRLCPCPYMSICPMQQQTTFVRSGNLFSVINSPMELLASPDKVQRFLRCNQQGYTSWPVALKAHTSDGMLYSFACLSCLMILVSHHWSHSFKIFLAVLLSEM